MQRRTWLQIAAGAALGACSPSRSLIARPTSDATTNSSRVTNSSRAVSPDRVVAVAFDLFTLFDPTTVDRRVASLVDPDKAAAFAATWKTRLFEYSWLRAAAGMYAPFDRLVVDALAVAMRTHRVSLDADAQRRLTSVFAELDVWPDTRDVLAGLRARRLKLATLANFSPRMIASLLDHGGLTAMFDAQLSGDTARTYKPDPRAYALAPAWAGTTREQVAFAAFGGWDAAGGQWFGFPTFWVNRFGAASDELVHEIATGTNLEDLARWLG